MGGSWAGVTRGSRLLGPCHCLAQSLKPSSLSKGRLGIDHFFQSVCKHTDCFWCPPLRHTYTWNAWALGTHSQRVIYNWAKGKSSPASQALFWEVEPSISQTDRFSVIAAEQYRAACLSSSGWPVRLCLPHGSQSPCLPPRKRDFQDFTNLGICHSTTELPKSFSIREYFSNEITTCQHNVYHSCVHFPFKDTFLYDH